MNAHTTQLLAEHRTNNLHAEADQVRLARLARAQRGETGPGVASRLVARIRAIGRSERPAPTMATRHAD
jgi:hypothetical protein